MKKSGYWHENMSFAQKDRLDRIQHIFLSTTEKKFHRKQAKNAEVKMSKNFLTSDLLGVILCGESIARTPKMWKRFPDSGKKLDFWNKNQTFLDFYEKTVDS